jgi:hypothetical protein
MMVPGENLSQENRVMRKGSAVTMMRLICLCLLCFSIVLADLPADGFGQLLEIDILREHGNGTDFTSLTILSALKKYGINNRVVFVLSPGTWKVNGVLEIPENVTLKLQEGALISLEFGNSLILDGPVQAGRKQIFSGDGKVLFRRNRQDVIPQWWKSGVDGNYFTALQKALASGAGALFFPEGVYEVSIKKEYPVKSLTIQGNIRLYGESDKSVIKLVESPQTDGVWAAYEMFSGNGIANVEISQLTFDAEKFYPDPETTSRLDPSIKGTRAVRIANIDNCKIVGCYFKGFTNGSAYVTGKNIIISGNSFYHGSYRTQTVRLDKSRHVTVSENTFDDNGPHYYVKLGSSNEMASVDALMVGYEVEDAQIINNKITRTAANGIRVENSRNVQVVGNLLDTIGESGIVFYRKTTDCGCRNNVISNWGKSNNLSYIRKQNGKIYNPREYHYPPPKYPPLPDKLDTAATWELNRYFLQGRDESTIPEYNPKDYKTILAFRGYAAISVEELSERVVISENRITGNLSKTGGLYNYASNYGISIGVTSINPPTSSGDCVIKYNTINECIDFDIYCPQYVDPAARRGVATPSRVYGNKCDPAKINFFYTKT